MGQERAKPETKAGEPLAGHAFGHAWRSTLRGPLVTYSAATTVLGLVGVGLFGTGFLPLAATGLGAVGLAGGLLHGLLLKRDRHLADYLAAMAARFEARQTAMMAELEISLATLENQHAAQQLSAFQRKFAAFRDVLDAQFEPGEMTYSRYLSVAEQVYLSGLDNLKAVVVAAKGLAGIDAASLHTRLEALADDGASARIRSTLEERRRLLATSQAEIDERLAQNERALTELDRVTALLAGINTRRGMAEHDMDTLMAELKRIAERAKDYELR